MEIKKLTDSIAEKLDDIRSYSQIKLFFRKIKWFFQRGKRGWADCDTWSLDHYLADVISGSLIHLKNNTHSYPGDGMSFEEWQDVLQKISDAYKEYNEYNDWHMDLMDREGYSNIEATKKATEKYNDILERMQLMIKWFEHLWD